MITPYIYLYLYIFFSDLLGTELKKHKKLYTDEKQKAERHSNTVNDLRRDLNSLRAVAAQAGTVSVAKGHLENEVN